MRLEDAYWHFPKYWSLLIQLTSMQRTLICKIFSKFRIFFVKFKRSLSALEQVINSTICNFLIAKFCTLSRVSSDRISFFSSKARVPLLWDSSVLSARPYKSNSNGFIKLIVWPPQNGAKASNSLKNQLFCDLFFSISFANCKISSSHKTWISDAADCALEFRIFLSSLYDWRKRVWIFAGLPKIWIFLSFLSNKLQNENNTSGLHSFFELSTSAREFFFEVV